MSMILIFAGKWNYWYREECPRNWQSDRGSIPRKWKDIAGKRIRVLCLYSGMSASVA
jgi:hypothetical protein